MGKALKPVPGAYGQGTPQLIAGPYMIIWESGTLLKGTFSKSIQKILFIYILKERPLKDKMT